MCQYLGNLLQLVWTDSSQWLLVVHNELITCSLFFKFQSQNSSKVTKMFENVMDSENVFGDGTSIIFYGPPRTGKKLRIKELESIFNDCCFKESCKIVFNHHVTMSPMYAKDHILWWNSSLKATQFFIPCYGSREMLDKIVLDFPQFKISIIELFTDNDDYLSAICGQPLYSEEEYILKARNWAKSWAYFRNFSSSSKDVEMTLKTSTDFFQHFPNAFQISCEYPTRTIPENVGFQRILSLSLQGLDFSNQDDFADFTDKWEINFNQCIQDHVASLKSVLIESTNFIMDIVKIILNHV